MLFVRKLDGMMRIDDALLKGKEQHIDTILLNHFLSSSSWCVPVRPNSHLRPVLRLSGSV